MAATHRWMNGRRATLASWRAAASSIGTPRVQALIGTPPSGWITSYERSLDMAGLLHLLVIVDHHPHEHEPAQRAHREDQGDRGDQSLPRCHHRSSPEVKDTLPVGPAAGGETGRSPQGQGGGE